MEWKWDEKSACKQLKENFQMLLKSEKEKSKVDTLESPLIGLLDTFEDTPKKPVLTWIPINDPLLEGLNLDDNSGNSLSDDFFENLNMDEKYAQEIEKTTWSW